MTSRRGFLNAMVIMSSVPVIPGALAGVPGEAISESLNSFIARRSTENSYWYIGHLMSVLATSEQTGGKYALLRATERQGMEPPPHTHTREDETFLVLGGEAKYTVGNETFEASAGDVVFLPKDVQHAFKIQTETLETLMLLTPGGFEKYFVEMSEPAQAAELPPMPQGPPDVAKIIATASRYGIKFPDKP